MSGAIPPLLQYASMAWCSVKKHRDKFTFTYVVGLLVWAFLRSEDFERSAKSAIKTFSLRKDFELWTINEEDFIVKV
jgi:hypothetical protein